MAWTTQKWLNLRATNAYVTDAAGQVPVANGGTNLPAYPKSITLDSDTFDVGWVVGTVDGARDRDSAYDTRLAGTNFATNASGSPTEFRIDLLGGAGDYEIRLASGDPTGFGTTKPHIKIYDDTTLLATIDGTAGIADFMDTTGVSFPNSGAPSWPANNSPLTLTFSSTTAPGSNPKLRFVCGDTAVSGATALNTIGIKKVGAGGGGTTILMGQACL